MESVFTSRSRNSLAGFAGHLDQARGYTTEYKSGHQTG